ncbi:MAG: ABC transporter substrate-binding protein [Alphaproteobacteria bacterium]
MNRRQFLEGARIGLGLGFSASVLLWTQGYAQRAIPKRVVIAGGALTEIAVALGAGKNLVGVDTTSLYPPTVVDPLPKIGYLRTLGAEGILSLNPTLLLVSDQAGPPGILDQLRSLKVPMAVVPETFSVDNVRAKIIAVATALSINGKSMLDAVTADLTAVRSVINPIKDRPKVMFILSAAGGRLMVAGTHTAAASMIAFAGGRNAIEEYEGYKPLSNESAVASEPDFILMSGQTVESAGAIDTIKSLPAIASLSAAKAGRIAIMDTLYLLGFGPRIAHAALDLAKCIHPKIIPPFLPNRPWMHA